MSVSPLEYQNIIDQQFPNAFLINISYNLAHNIIFSGYEFAGKFGFKPCKKFSETTQYFLYPENNNTNKEPIACGFQNRPLVIETDYNQTEVKITIDHLIKTVGKNGFKYVKEIKEMNGFEEDEFEEDLPIEEYIYDQPVKERHEDIKRFMELSNLPDDDQSEDNAIELLYTSKKLFYNHFGLEEIEEKRALFINFFNVEIDDDTIPSSFSGTSDPFHIEKIEEIYNSFGHLDELKNFKIKKLANTYPEVPFYTWMVIFEMEYQDTASKKILKFIDEALSIDPENVLLLLERDKHLALEGKKAQFINDKIIEKGASSLFKNRNSIHLLELFSLHSALFETFENQKDCLAIDALCFAVSELFPEYEDFFSGKALHSELMKVAFCTEKFIK